MEYSWIADPGDDEQYLYDPNGNRTSLRKRDGSTLTYQYDALNRMTAKIVPERAGLTAAQTRDVHYEYDLRGLQTAASFDGPANDFVRTWYDGFGRPATVLTHMFGQPRYLNHQYDRDGHREHLIHTNDGARFRYYYDGLGRMTHLLDNPAAASPDDYVIRYFYRPEGPRYVAIRGAGAAGFTTAYHYDPVQRLATMVNDLPGAGNDMTVTLAYNPASQIRHYGRDNDAYAWTGSVAVTRPYTTNGQNQYLAAGPANFSYDSNGNLIWDSSNNYVYDVENRLVSASGEKSATLVYDPLGRLAQVSGGAAGVTRFLYDGDKLIAEYDAVGTLLKRYVHGPGVDEPVAVYEGPALGLAGRRYMLPDERGSVAALVNANGTPSAINSYNEYGVPGAEPVGRFGYTGQTWIPELGLWYYKARFYSSRLGRFLQVDPIGYEGGINIYAYVGNDPLNGIDPTGLYECAKGNNCEKFEGYRQQLIVARDSYKADSPEYGRIDAALKNIGEPDTPGMLIEEGGENTKYPGVVATIGGSRMTIYTPTLEAMAQGINVDVNEFGAATIGHEADSDHMGPIKSLSERRAAEIGGYTTEDAVNRAFGNRVGPSNDRSEKDRSKRIISAAEQSVAAACRNSTHVTCR